MKEGRFVRPGGSAMKLVKGLPANLLIRCRCGLVFRNGPKLRARHDETCDRADALVPITHKGQIVGASWPEASA